MHTDPYSHERPDTLVQILKYRATYQPESVAYSFIYNGSICDAITYRDLYQRARSLAAALQAMRLLGERALICLPSGLDYVLAFWGCVCAGVIPVPAYPPRANSNFDRLLSISKNAQCKVAFANSSTIANVREQEQEKQNSLALRWLAMDEFPTDTHDQWDPYDSTIDGLAYLQFSSGSTAEPHGVMLTHGNVLANSACIQERFEHTHDDIMVSWLPLHHDMGLVGSVLEPLFVGYQSIIMPATAFIQKPMRWLEAISKYRATVSGGPNFAYDICCRRIKSEQTKAIDLSCWQLAFCGSEPIDYRTIELFSSMFADCQFRPQAFYPCYGLAEATLLVSGGSKNQLPVIADFSDLELEHGKAVRALGTTKSRRLVGCGRCVANHSLLIVDPASGEALSSGHIGEIWVSGPSIAMAYWQNQMETQEVFQGRLSRHRDKRYLRTGDLGCIVDDQIFITGRIKDLIIIRGRNIYPQDIEKSVQSCDPSLHPTAGAAFAIEVNGRESLVVVQEISRHYPAHSIQNLMEKINVTVVYAHDIQPHAVILIREGSIPRTTSGKLRRQTCRSEFLGGTLTIVAKVTAGST